MNKIAPVWKWLLILLLALARHRGRLSFRHRDPRLGRRAWKSHGKHAMRLVSRFGDWPEHVFAGLIIVAIAACAAEALDSPWPNDDCCVCPCRHRGTRCQDRNRPRPAVGKTRTRLERPAFEPEIQLFPKRTHCRDHRVFRRALFRQPPGRFVSSADPVSYRRLTHVCRGTLSFRRRLRRAAWYFLCLALRTSHRRDFHRLKKFLRVTSDNRLFVSRLPLSLTIDREPATISPNRVWEGSRLCRDPRNSENFEALNEEIFLHPVRPSRPVLATPFSRQWPMISL